MQFQSIALSQPLEVVFEPTHFPPDFPFVLWPTGRPGELREKAAYLHYHNELEIGWCVSGSGVFFVEEKVIPFRAPCVSLIYGGQIHIAQSSPGEGAQWYFVNTDARALGLGDFPGHTAAPVIAADEPGGQELAALAELLVEELRDGAPDAGRCAQGLVQAMLCRHARLGGGAPGSSWRIAEISPAVSYLANHYAEPCSVALLARLCGFSEATLRRKFRQAVGCAPLEYLHRIRVEAASAMLRSENKTVLEICEQVGYSSPSSFNREFRRLTGKSPREARHAYLENE